MAKVLKQIYPTARKEHQCYFCGGIINNPINTIMTVKQLKDELEKFDENLPVKVIDRWERYECIDDCNLTLEVSMDDDGESELYI